LVHVSLAIMSGLNIGLTLASCYLHVKLTIFLQAKTNKCIKLIVFTYLQYIYHSRQVKSILNANDEIQLAIYCD